MEKFKVYTNEIAKHLDSKYKDLVDNMFAKDLVDNMFANDVAYDLSMGYNPAGVYLSRCHGINRYHRSTEQSRDIFTYVYNYMKK